MGEAVSSYRVLLNFGPTAWNRAPGWRTSIGSGLPVQDLWKARLSGGEVKFFISQHLFSRSPKNWLIGGLEHVLLVHNIWDNPSHWPSYFSRWLKPPIIELDDGTIYSKTLYLMVKNMVSCRFSLKPIQWTKQLTFPALSSGSTVPALTRNLRWARQVMRMATAGRAPFCLKCQQRPVPRRHPATTLWMCGMMWPGGATKPVVYLK